MTDLDRECAAEALYRACGLRPTGTQWDDDARTRRRWRANLDHLAADGWVLVRRDDLRYLMDWVDWAWATTDDERAMVERMRAALGERALGDDDT